MKSVSANSFELKKQKKNTSYSMIIIFTISCVDSYYNERLQESLCAPLTVKDKDGPSVAHGTKCIVEEITCYSMHPSLLLHRDRSI